MQTFNENTFKLRFREKMDEGGHSYDPFDVQAAWEEYQNDGQEKYKWLE